MAQVFTIRDIARRCIKTPQLNLALFLSLLACLLDRWVPGIGKRNYFLLKRCLCLLVVLSAHCCSAQVVDSAKIGNSLAKCWRVLSHEYSNIYGLELDEIKRYSKQKVCFTKDSIRMLHGVLNAPKYSIKKVNADNYAKNNFDCSRQKMGILVDSIFEITISSVTRPAADGTIHKMTDVITFDGDCIYVVVDGVIFKMFDADAKIQGRSSN